ERPWRNVRYSPGGIRTKAGDRTVIDELLATRTEGRADDHLREAITVHVASGAHAAAEGHGELIPFRRPGRIISEPPCRAMIDKNPALEAFTVRIKVRADQDVGVAVPVHIARRSDHSREVGAILVAFGRPVGGAIEAAGRAEKDERLAHVLDAVVPPVGADDDIGETIAVHI